MLREEQVRLLKGLISHLDAGTNVDAKGIVENPADTYTSEERFSEENLTVKRPGSGISPMRWDEIIGEYAAHDFAMDELIEL